MPWYISATNIDYFNSSIFIWTTKKTNFEYNNLSLVVPFQSGFTLDIAHIPSSKDRIKAYFDGTTFDDGKQFYSKFDTEFIQIEKTSERIIISSLDIYSKERYEIYLNYQDKSVEILIGNELQFIYE